MRVLYCNPSFWDYRLPFYEELNRLFGGDFHVVYSTKRYRGAHQALLPRIAERLGANAHPWDGEIVYDNDVDTLMHLGDITFELTGSGTKVLSVYYNGELDHTQTVEFSQ